MLPIKRSYRLSNQPSILYSLIVGSLVLTFFQGFLYMPIVGVFVGIASGIGFHLYQKHGDINMLKMYLRYARQPSFLSGNQRGEE